MFVTNEAVSSCCGQPTRNCSCGGQQPNNVNNEKMPEGGSLTENGFDWAAFYGDSLKESKETTDRGGIVLNADEDKQPAGGGIGHSVWVW